MRQPLGQHFLKNKSAIVKIIAALELKKDDAVIEIGPGKGALTIPLAKECAKVGCKIIAIEKDAELAFRVKRLGFREEILEVKIGDALKELPYLVNSLVNRRDPSARAPLDGGREMATGYKVAGNIPYYITGHLLRVISELPMKPSLTVLMVQKEVAERVSAKPGKMNLLAAATQIWADVSIIFRLKPDDFNPPPEVESAVIKLKSKNEKVKTEEVSRYYRLIHAAFKQPRKTLLNNLMESDMGQGARGKEEQENKKTKKQKMQKETMLSLLKSLGLNEKTRAQELSVEQLEEMGRVLSIKY